MNRTSSEGVAGIRHKEPILFSLAIQKPTASGRFLRSLWFERFQSAGSIATSAAIARLTRNESISFLKSTSVRSSMML